MIIRFHFVDCGQDFLWWDVKDDGRAIGEVVDAGPFQAWAWADGKHFVNLNEPHDVGDRLATTNDLQRSLDTGYSEMLNYPVEKVERLEDAT